MCPRPPARGYKIMYDSYTLYVLQAYIYEYLDAGAGRSSYRTSCVEYVVLFTRLHAFVDAEEYFWQGCALPAEHHVFRVL